jgi:hypothetical protein
MTLTLIWPAEDGVNTHWKVPMLPGDVNGSEAMERGDDGPTPGEATDTPVTPRAPGLTLSKFAVPLLVTVRATVTD